MNISAILPHVRKYGGVRRYLEFGNALIKSGNSFTLYVTDLNHEYDWIKELQFRGRIEPVEKISEDKGDACLCGDAGSLSYLDKSNAKLKVVNVIFPPYSTYLLGNYGDYLNRDDLLVVGNSTGWHGDLDWRNNWHTIPGAVNLEMFKPEGVVNHENFRVLFFAKNRPWKGLDTIMFAYNSMKHMKGIEWGYFDSERHDDLPPEIKSHISLPQTSMAGLYSSYDCFVSAEQLAGWQNTVAEAMACGTPVITTAIGTRDFAVHNRTAYVIPEKKPSEIVKAISLFKKTESFRKALARAGRAKIQTFSWSQYTENWLAYLYEKLSASKSSGVNLTDIETQAEKVRKVADLHKSKVSQQVSTLQEFVPEPNMKDEGVKTDSKKEYDLTSQISKRAESLKRHLSGNQLSSPDTPAAAPVQNVKIEATSKPFDKYEKFGAYHWTGHDKVYEGYTEKLTRIMVALKSLHGNFDVLDVGGGDGYVAKKLLNNKICVHIIDTNETAVKLSKEKLAEEINVGKATVAKQDFFGLPTLPTCVLLSQVIEHFNEPEKFVEKIGIHKPPLVVVTTPIKKEDGTMWDEAYHTKEFSPDEFLTLFEPLRDAYSMELTLSAPYNQYLILQHKRFALENYLKALNIYLTTVVSQEGEDVEAKVKASKKYLKRMVDAVLSITSNTPRVGELSM